ncbi:SDR family NAD(P)-dependent oxidoreductase, partial [Streptomyces sp. 6N223]|uniref:SDR family NAD(P)-dependent oxidoreductase n=1 Tax=Streptomyces sp. 6N223 TaxID=3457412 RepID=UPI003FD23FE7
ALTELADHLDAQADALSSVSHTLMSGRHHFDHRCALIVHDHQDAVRLLRNAAQGETPLKVHRGTVAREFTPNAAMADLVQDLVAQARASSQDPVRYQDQLTALADLYRQGYTPSLQELFDRPPTRISLPGYPFDNKPYWPAPITATATAAIAASGKRLHPLVHENVSDLSEQRYRSVFTGDEPFLADHVVNGRKTLPAAAYLEIAREAARQAAGGGALRLNNIRWVQPMAMQDDPLQVRITLIPEPDGTIGFEIVSGGDDGHDESPVIHGQGDAALVESQGENPVLDLSALRADCPRTLSGEDCYDAFAAAHLRYGPAHRTLAELHVGTDVLLARLIPPPETEDGYVLHPSLIDGAFQAPAGFGVAAGAVERQLPFALDAVEIFDSGDGGDPPAWAVVRKLPSSGSRASRFDIDVCDDAGRIRFRFKGFTSSLGSGSGSGSSSNAAVPPVTGVLEMAWSPSELDAGQRPSRTWRERHLIVCDCDATHLPRDPAVHTVAVDSTGDDPAERYTSLATQLFTKVKDILLAKPQHDVLLQVVVPDTADYAGLAGLLKSARLENPKLTTQLIAMPLDTPDAMARINAEAAALAPAPHVRYADGRRLLPTWQPLPDAPPDAAPHTPWRADGTYLITGGAGGLGLLFAREIAERAPGARIVLTGRSARQEHLHLAIPGAEYRQLDVTDPAAVTETLAGIGPDLRGILHCAGVIRDDYIIRKPLDDVRQVLAPKVTGLVNLDRAAADLGLELDFLVCFASTSGSLGNAGQADYALGNAFMDAFAARRNDADPTRPGGRTLAIDWALWRDGGMTMGDGDQTLAQLEARTGLVPIPADAGIAAFYRSLASGAAQTLCLTVRDARQLPAATDRFNSVAEPTPTTAPAAPATPAEQPDLTAYLTNATATVMKLPLDVIDSEAPLERYGIDSISVIALTDRLEKDFGTLPKTLFFEYQTLAELSRYLQDSYPAEVARLFTEPEPERGPEAATEAPAGVVSRRRERAARFAAVTPTPARPERSPDVAIIGLAGRYPQAPDLDTFWENLLQGRDSVTEIPEDRWDYRAFYYDADKSKKDNVYCRWGGFLEGVDRFDPMFFNISPREAELMDPQERLFLECAYATLQDAGYTPGDLDDAGVFVGLMTSDYQLFGVERQLAGQPVAVAGNFASVANRISYHLNFHGPSLSVDTMCSSSLTAISLACESLRLGNCEVAIAGGVNLSLHPNKYLLLSQGKFASSNGRCESFGDEGDGYVPSEGVGAVLLKPLDAAVRDRDHIYGVIKGTAVNHGGKTNGYSVPSPGAQGAVIGKALREAGVDPRAISYVEAHGTGTKLGDPIEIRGLSQAFEALGVTGSDGQSCAIGSVKSTIGHAEGAAGIAGLTKVLLQMRHGTLVPSLHSDVLNPLIDFGETPFVVQREAAEWRRPAGHPRIAGLSSFGAGGSNAHMIVEEYRAYRAEERAARAERPDPVVIPLSAKTEVALRQSAERLLTAVRGGRYADDDLPAMAYTLQVGREAMPHRLGFVARDLAEVAGKLAAWLDGPPETEAEAEPERDPLLAAWVAGENVDWRQLYLGEDGAATTPPGRISLPIYPFAEERYWLPAPEGQPEGEGVQRRLHPLVHEVRAADGTPVLRVSDLDVAVEAPELPEVEVDVVAAAGPGRRAEMAGWSVAQCLEWELKDVVSQVLKLPMDRLDDATSLQDFGFDSISLVEFAGVLVERLHVELTPDVFFSFPTLGALSGHLLEDHGETVEAFYRQGSTAPPPEKRPAPELRRRVARRSTPAPAPVP